MNWKFWLYTLAAAFITGFATAVTASPGCDFIGQPLNWKQIIAVGLSGGFVGVCAFLKKSPLPGLPDSSSPTPTSLDPKP